MTATRSQGRGSAPERHGDHAQDHRSTLAGADPLLCCRRHGRRGGNRGYLGDDYEVEYPIRADFGRVNFCLTRGAAPGWESIFNLCPRPQRRHRHRALAAAAADSNRRLFTAKKAG